MTKPRRDAYQVFISLCRGNFNFFKFPVNIRNMFHTKEQSTIYLMNFALKLGKLIAGEHSR